jgi:hypothetical protein
LTSQNPETYENESSSIAYRLCPNDVGCDNDYEYGCAEGFGDYVVGLKTFVDAFFEEQEQGENNNNYDDYFDVEEFVECSEYEAEEDEDDGNNGNYNYNQKPYNQYSDNGNFYVGPTCSADGINVALGLFQDEYCSNPANNVTFENLSNGMSLPFSDGGLVSTYCTGCVTDNDGDGEYEISEFCDDVYKHAALSCETEMNYFSYNGQHNYACEFITELVPFYAEANKEVTGKKIGKTIFVIFTILALVGGLVGYVVWWRSKKATSVVDTTENQEGTLA